MSLEAKQASAERDTGWNLGRSKRVRHPHRVAGMDQGTVFTANARYHYIGLRYREGMISPVAWNEKSANLPSRTSVIPLVARVKRNTPARNNAKCIERAECPWSNWRILFFSSLFFLSFNVVRQTVHERSDTRHIFAHGVADGSREQRAAGFTMLYHNLNVFELRHWAVKLEILNMIGRIKNKNQWDASICGMICASVTFASQSNRLSV